MIVWPFRPNWTSPYVETYTYLTEIILSDSGREQRRTLRGAARRTIEYSALLVDADLHTLRALLNRRVESVQFPDEVRIARLAGAARYGLTTVDFVARPAWIATGRKVVFEDGASRERIVRTVAAIVGDEATFDEVNDRTWGVTTRVMPALTGQMSATMRGTARTNAAGQFAVALEVEPGTEVEDVAAAVTTFNDREVMTITPNWTRAPDIEIVDPTQWTDHQMGVRTAYRPVDFNTEIRQAEYLLRSQDDVDATLGAFQRARGRRGEFYQSSGLSDFALMQTVTSGNVLWRVPGHGFHAAYDGDTVHRAFAVVLRSGVTLRFSVVDITTGGTLEPYSQIQTSVAAPYEISPDDVVMISWLPVVRFASDELSLTWHTDQVADAMVNTQTLEDL